jgi:hypothetical protein
MRNLGSGRTANSPPEPVARTTGKGSVKFAGQVLTTLAQGPHSK